MRKHDLLRDPSAGATRMRLPRTHGHHGITGSAGARTSLGRPLRQPAVRLGNVQRPPFNSKPYRR